MNLARFKDGSIVHFAHSTYDYMKVCSIFDGRTGIVNLSTGGYLTPDEVRDFGEPTIVAESIDEWYMKIFKITP